MVLLAEWFTTTLDVYLRTDNARLFFLVLTINKDLFGMNFRLLYIKKNNFSIVLMLKRKFFNP